MFLEKQGFMIGDLHIRIPIVQGGMGVGISGSGLASAVANTGGVGVISAVGVAMLDSQFASRALEYSTEALKSEIAKARKLTKGVLGVNIMVALSNFEEMAKAAIEAGIDIIFAGAGLPLTLPKVVGENCKTKLIPIVSSVKAANTIYRWWMEKYQYVPDGFVLEGPMAGGHLGFKTDQIDDPAYSLENITPPVVEFARALEAKHGKKVVVIAGGGVFDGADIKRILDLGVDAVQMATRFVATDEADCHINFKNAYVNCKEEDIGIIQSPVGLPGRAIINGFIEQTRLGNKVPKHCPFHCIKTCKMEESPYCISLALINACKGKIDNGFVFIGKNGYKIDKIVSVKELVDTLDMEYSGVLV